MPPQIVSALPKNQKKLTPQLIKLKYSARPWFNFNGILGDSDRKAAVVIPMSFSQQQRKQVYVWEQRTADKNKQKGVSLSLSLSIDYFTLVTRGIG